MNRRDRGVLIGMVLGDGCISVSKCYTINPKTGTKSPYTKSVLKLKHSVKQLDYMVYKQKLLHSIFGGKLNTIGRFRQKAFGKEWDMLQLSRNNKYFRVMKRYMYPSGRKTVTKKVLNWLTDAGLAIWLMDDGSVSINRNKKGEVTSYQFRLHTFFTKEEAELVVEWFEERYGVKVKAYQVKPDQWNLRWNTTSHRILTFFLQDYILPFMYYKFPDLQRHERDPALLS